VIAYYGKTLTVVVLRHQFLTLMVAVATLVGTVYSTSSPQGFFPVQDTGVIMAFRTPPQDISFAAMSVRQQALARAILKDPAVDSLLVVYRHRRDQPHDQHGPHPDQT